MEREEKVRAREGKKQEEFTGIKLRRAILVGKRGKNCTTPSFTWRFGLDGSINENPNFPTTKHSSRKLGANLWEVLPQLTAANMSRGGGYRHHRRRGHDHKDKGFQVPGQVDEDPPDSPHEEVQFRPTIVLFLLQNLACGFLFLICNFIFGEFLLG